MRATPLVRARALSFSLALAARVRRDTEEAQVAHRREFAQRPQRTSSSPARAARREPRAARWRSRSSAGSAARSAARRRCPSPSASNRDIARGVEETHRGRQLLRPGHATGKVAVFEAATPGVAPRARAPQGRDARRGVGRRRRAPTSELTTARCATGTCRRRRAGSAEGRARRLCARRRRAPRGPEDVAHGRRRPQVPCHVRALALMRVCVEGGCNALLALVQRSRRGDALPAGGGDRRSRPAATSSGLGRARGRPRRGGLSHHSRAITSLALESTRARLVSGGLLLPRALCARARARAK